MEKTYSVIPFNQNRFAIADLTGKIIDDAQGYGYKTAPSAHRAASWKLKGGKEKDASQKKQYKKWLKENPAHEVAVKTFNEYMEWNVKEIARKELTLEDLWNTVEAEYGLSIPDFVRKQVLK